MNLVALKTFLAAVQTGNLNKAAELINVTQSTVTARLDVLDSELGQALLVRSRKDAQLTKAGFAFQRHGELMVRTWEQGCKAVGLPSGFSGMVSLTCHPELWSGLGDRWIDLAQATQEDTAFEAWPGEHSEIIRWLIPDLSNSDSFHGIIAVHSGRRGAQRDAGRIGQAMQRTRWAAMTHPRGRALFPASLSCAPLVVHVPRRDTRLAGGKNRSGEMGRCY